MLKKKKAFGKEEGPFGRLRKEQMGGFMISRGWGWEKPKVDRVDHGRNDVVRRWERRSKWEVNE